MKNLPHQLTNNVKLLQKVVLKYNERVLILKRAENSNSRPLNWDLPGGNSQWPETTENKENLYKNDAVREVFEETGITISSDKFIIKNLVDFRTFFEADKQIFSVIVGWSINLKPDFDEESIKISNEHIDYKWILLTEIDNYDFGGLKGKFIKDIIKASFNRRN